MISECDTAFVITYVTPQRGWIVFPIKNMAIL
jgi:hypothetical protein